MSHVTDLRSLARERAAHLRAIFNGNVRAEAILAAAERETGVSRVPLAAGDVLLDGGDAVYDPEPRLIWYNRDVDPGLAAMYQAHEYAHLWLGHSGLSHRNARDLDPESPDEPVPLGVHRVEGYGPKERRERDANVFARELLLPTDLLRQWFIEEGLDAVEIAERVGVPLGVVYHQLAYAVLVGDLPRAEPRSAAQSRAGQPAGGRERARLGGRVPRVARSESAGCCLRPTRTRARRGGPRHRQDASPSRARTSPARLRYRPTGHSCAHVLEQGRRGDARARCSRSA